MQTFSRKDEGYSQNMSQDTGTPGEEFNSVQRE
jgi:hypothetical protein